MVHKTHITYDELDKHIQCDELDITEDAKAYGDQEKYRNLSRMAIKEARRLIREDINNNTFNLPLILKTLATFRRSIIPEDKIKKTSFGMSKVDDPRYVSGNSHIGIGIDENDWIHLPKKLNADRDKLYADRLTRFCAYSANDQNLPPDISVMSSPSTEEILFNLKKLENYKVETPNFLQYLENQKKEIADKINEIKLNSTQPQKDIINYSIKKIDNIVELTKKIYGDSQDVKKLFFSQYDVGLSGNDEFNPINIINYIKMLITNIQTVDRQFISSLKKYRCKTILNLDGEPIILSQVITTYKENDLSEIESIGFGYTEAKKIPLVLNEIILPLYQRIILSSKGENQINAISDLYWYLSKVSLYVRGSAAINKWLNCALLSELGYSFVPANPKRHLDYLAILMPSYIRFRNIYKETYKPL